MQGWITCFAWISTLAGVANTTAYMLQSLVAANYPSYEPKAWHLTLLIFALLVMGGLMNMYAWFLIPWLETLAGVLHILLFVVFVVVLVTVAPRHSADFVFLKSASSSGWNNQFVSFNMGLMTPTWGFVGEFWQSTSHMQLRLADGIIRVRRGRSHV
jgi:choline transport protein